MYSSALVRASEPKPKIEVSGNIEYEFLEDSINREDIQFHINLCFI